VRLPPKDVKRWFDEYEKEQMELLDRPGGWNSRSRRYRLVFAVITALIVVAEMVFLAIVLGDGKADALVVSIIIVVPILVFLSLLVVDAPRAFRFLNSRRRDPPTK